MGPWMAAVYAFPTTEKTMTIVSASANDDQAAVGPASPTGAWTVTVYYLDINFVEKSKTVTLAGTTPVTIATICTV